MAESLTIPARQEHKSAPRAPRPARRSAAPRPAPFAAQPVASPSLIHALHARYEKARAEHHRIDVHNLAVPNDGSPSSLSEGILCDRGMHASEIEADLLRLLILRQVPIDDEELTIIAFHANGMADAAMTLDEGERTALEAGVGAIFDYLVSENRIDINGPGREFRAGAMNAFHARRYRTGETQED